MAVGSRSERRPCRGGRRASASIFAPVVLVVVGCGAAPGPPPAPAASVAPASSPSSLASSPSSPVRPQLRLIVAATWDEVGIGGGEIRTTLRVRPTPAALASTADGARARGWAEVVALVPEADIPTMRDQFDCHWRFARLVAPDKESWNLEPWRPVVDAETMIEKRCNPGGPEI